MKYVDLSAIPLTWTQVGTANVTSSLGGGWVRPTAVIINGYYGLFYACSNGANPANTRGAILYLFDGLGGVCIYQTSDFINGADINNLCPGSQVWAAGNTITYSLLNGGTWQMIIPNVFKAGQTYVLPARQLTVNSPCGVGTFVTAIYASSQKLIAYEWAQGFATASNIYGSIYDTLGNFKGGGFIGNYPNGQDGFNQVVNNLPPSTFTSDIYYKNGFNVFGNFGSVGANQQAFGGNQPYVNGNPNALTCGVANPSVFVSGNAQFTNYPYRDFNAPAFGAGSYGLSQCITDMLGFFVFNDGAPTYLLSKDWMVSIPAQGTNISVCYNYAQRKLYYRDNSISAQRYAGNVYVASFDINQFGIGPLPIVQASAHNGLVNYHRAVSPTGIFQT